jgi:hypothetical protein
MTEYDLFVRTFSSSELGEVKYLVEMWPYERVARATLLPTHNQMAKQRKGLNEIMDWFLKNHQMLAAGQFWCAVGQFPRTDSYTLHQIATNPFWDRDTTIMRAAARELKEHRMCVYPGEPEKRMSGDPGYVYLAFCDTGHFKIGRSVDPEARIQHFDTQMPVNVKKAHVFHADNAAWAEASLHYWLDDCRYKGEWFALSDAALYMVLGIDQFREGHFVQRYADRNVEFIDPSNHLPKVRPGFLELMNRSVN